MPPIDTRTVLAIARRPDLWTTLAKAGLELAPQGWWRRRPFLPLPDPGWLAFRMETAYGGDGNGPMRAEDLVTWLEWKRSR